MNFVILGTFLLLEAAYFSSPLAQCMDQVSEPYLLGKWLADKNNHTDHEVLMSKDGVYVINNHQLLVRKFHYAGGGPWPQFVVGPLDYPTNDSFTCLYGDVTDPAYVLPKFIDYTDLLVEWNENVPMKDSKFFAIFCRIALAVFAWMPMPKPGGTPMPEMMELGEFLEPNADHKVKGKVKALSSQVFELSEFDFDPTTVTTIFFMVGTTDKPDDSGGEKLPDEEMKDPPEPIKKPYTAQTIMVKLRQDTSYCMYKWFGIYDEEKKVALGHVMLKPGMIPPEVGQHGKGWGPLSTTTDGSQSSIDDSTTEEELGDTDPPTSTEPTTTPSSRVTHPRSTDKPTPGNSVMPESSYGSILAAASIALYFRL